MNSVFISMEELRLKLDTDDVPIIVDATWHMPHLQLKAYNEYYESRIPGAHFFDLDAESDPSVSLPHMMPSKRQMDELLQKMGIGIDDNVVVYEKNQLCTSARFWFMLKVFGFSNVKILSSGFTVWQKKGYPVETGAICNNKKNKVPFPIELRSDHIICQDKLIKMMDKRECQLVDVRSESRFLGIEPEPRPGVKSGGIKNALNLPFLDLSTAEAPVSKDKFKKIVAKCGLDLNKPIVSMCGSGVTACVLIAMFEEIGKTDVLLYDGSWSEWGRI